MSSVLGMAVLGVALCAQPAGAATLDWNTNAWPSTGALSASYTIGSGDVDLDFSDPDGVLVTSPSGGAPGSPATNTHLNTPLNNGSQNLFIRATGNNGPNYVTLQVDFTHVSGVTNVGFNLYDIDAQLGQWRDVIVVTGFAVGGGTVTPSVAAATGSPSWTWTPGTNTLTGSTPNQTNTTDNGTALVSFSTAITGFELRYENLESPFGNQWIALSSILFLIIPEPSAILLWLTAAAPLALLLARRA